jgi:hypothetical protein
VKYPFGEYHEASLFPVQIFCPEIVDRVRVSFLELRYSKYQRMISVEYPYREEYLKILENEKE